MTSSESRNDFVTEYKQLRKRKIDEVDDAEKEFLKKKAADFNNVAVAFDTGKFEKFRLDVMGKTTAFRSKMLVDRESIRDQVCDTLLRIRNLKTSLEQLDADQEQLDALLAAEFDQLVPASRLPQRVINRLTAVRDDVNGTETIDQALKRLKEIDKSKLPHLVLDRDGCTRVSGVLDNEKSIKGLEEAKKFQTEDQLVLEAADKLMQFRAKCKEELRKSLPVDGQHTEEQRKEMKQLLDMIRDETTAKYDKTKNFHKLATARPHQWSFASCEVPNALLWKELDD